MTVYLALLRGINVGGHNKIRMADLKDTFELLGFGNVKTYIQSGNVLFTSDRTEEELRHEIERELERRFSMSVPVVIRTSDELVQMVEECPIPPEAFVQAESSDVETCYISLLVSEPKEDAIEDVKKYTNDVNHLWVVDRNVYLWLQNGVRDSKLATNLHRLNVSSTMRNWKTINRLVALAQEMVQH